MTIVINDIQNPMDVSRINQNFQLLENYINQALLNRAGSVSDGNEMNNPLDMNEQPILNVKIDISNDGSLVTKKYVDDQNTATLVAAQDIAITAAEAAVAEAAVYTDQVGNTKLTLGDGTSLYNMLYAGSNIEILNLGDKVLISALVGGTVKSVNLVLPDGNGDVTLTASDLGLGNVDDTSDADKPISNATAGVLNQKQNKAPNDNKFYILQNGNIVEFTPSSSNTPYLGNWDASTNTPFISDATGSEGQWYICTVDGTQDLGSGAVAWENLDIVFHDNGTFKPIGKFGGSGSGTEGIPDTTGTIPKVRIENAWVTGINAEPYLQVVSFDANPVEGIASSATAWFNDPKTGSHFINNIKWLDEDDNVIGTKNVANLLYVNQGTQTIRCQVTMTSSGESITVEDSFVVNVTQQPGFDAIIFTGALVEIDGTFPITVRDDDISQATTTVDVKVRNMTNSNEVDVTLSRVDTTSFSAVYDMPTNTLGFAIGDDLRVSYIDINDSSNQASEILKTSAVIANRGFLASIVTKGFISPEAQTIDFTVYNDQASDVNQVLVVNSRTGEFENITTTQLNTKDQYTGTLTTVVSAATGANDSGTMNIQDGDILTYSIVDTADTYGNLKTVVQEQKVQNFSRMGGENWNVWACYNAADGTAKTDPVLGDFSKFVRTAGNDSGKREILTGCTPIPKGSWFTVIEGEDNYNSFNGTNGVWYVGVGFFGVRNCMLQASGGSESTGNYLSAIDTTVYTPNVMVTCTRSDTNYVANIYGIRIDNDTQELIATKVFNDPDREVFFRGGILSKGEIGTGDNALSIHSTLSKAVELGFSPISGFNEFIVPNWYLPSSDIKDLGAWGEHNYTKADDIPVVLHPGLNADGTTDHLTKISVPLPRGFLFDEDLPNVTLLNEVNAEVAIDLATDRRWRTLSNDTSFDGSVRNLLIQFEASYSGSVTYTVRFDTARTLNFVAPVEDWEDSWVLTATEINPAQLNSLPPVTLKEPSVYATLPPQWLSACLIQNRLENEGTDLTDQPWWFQGWEKTVNTQSRVELGPNFETWFPDAQRSAWLYGLATTFYTAYMRTGDVKWLRHFTRHSYAYCGMLSPAGFFLQDTGKDPKYIYSQPSVQLTLLCGAGAVVNNGFDVATNFHTYRRGAVYLGGLPSTSTDGITATEREVGYSLQTFIDKYCNGRDGEVTEDDKSRAIFAVNRMINQQFYPSYPSWLSGWYYHHSGHSAQDSEPGGSPDKSVMSPWQVPLVVNELQRYFYYSGDKRALQSISRCGEALTRWGVIKNVILSDVESSGPCYNAKYYTVDREGYAGGSSVAGVSSSAAPHNMQIIGSVYKAMVAKQQLGEDTNELEQALPFLWEGVRYTFTAVSALDRPTRNDDGSQGPKWALGGGGFNGLVRVDYPSLWENTAGDFIFNMEQTKKVANIVETPNLVEEDIVRAVEHNTVTTVDLKNNIYSSKEDLQLTGIITIQTQGSKGVSVVTDKEVAYTPNSGETGTDVVTYRVTDTGGEVRDGTISLNINPSLTAPFVFTSGVAIPVDYQDTIDLNNFVTVAAPQSIDPATAVIISPPTNFLVWDTSNLTTNLTVIYKPALGYVGTDTFTWQVSNNLAEDSNVGGFTYNVTTGNFPLIEEANSAVDTLVAGRVVVTTSEFNYTSINNTSPEIVITVDTVSGNVVIDRAGTPLTATDTYTMQDVELGIIGVTGVFVVPNYTITQTVRDTGSPQNSLPADISGSVTEVGTLMVDEFILAGDGTDTGLLDPLDTNYNANSIWTKRRDTVSGFTNSLMNVFPDTDTLGTLRGGLGNADDCIVWNDFTDKQYEIDFSTIDLSAVATSNDFFTFGHIASDSNTVPAGWASPTGNTRSRQIVISPTASNWLQVYNGYYTGGGTLMLNVNTGVSVPAGLTLFRHVRFTTDSLALKAEMSTSGFWYVKKDQAIEVWFDNGIDGKQLLFSLTNDVSGGYEFDILESRFNFQFRETFFELKRIAVTEVI